MVWIQLPFYDILCVNYNEYEFQLKEGTQWRS